MMEVVTYLLGAGASARCLPLAASLADRMEEFIPVLKSHIEDMDFIKITDKSVSPEHMKYDQQFYDALSWLATEARTHSTVDTFAKKLILLNDLRTLMKVKVTLSAYFLLLQSHERPDTRYDGFLATILQNNPFHLPTIPDNIRILTWNYDLQLERAYLPYARNDYSATSLNITNNTKSIVRINGIAGRYPPYGFSEVTAVAYSPFKIESILKVLNMWGTAVADLSVVSSDLSFAWEQKDYMLERSIAPVTAETTILVVIGYSFPFFNREVDQYILAKMPKVKKVYVQVPEDQHANLRNRLKAMNPDLPDVVCIGDTDRFYVPYEL